MYSSTYAVIHVNGYLSEHFSIMLLVDQEYVLWSLLYVEPLLLKSKTLRGISHDLGRGRAISAYVDGITIIVSISRHKRIQSNDGKINQEKSVSLHFVTWRGRFLQLNYVVEHWTEGPVKLLGIWFGPDLLVENLDEVTSRMTSHIKKWTKRKLFLESCVAVANASVIYYHLTIVFAPPPTLYAWSNSSACSLAICERDAFHLPGTPFVIKTHVVEGWECRGYRYADMCWSYDIFSASLAMRRSAFVWQHFPQFVSEFQSLIKCRARQCVRQSQLSTSWAMWHVEVPLWHSIEGLLWTNKFDDVFIETLGIYENKLAGLCWMFSGHFGAHE